ncbi:hypothetical protein ABZS66_12030 [Dactylosporangium sp. NPDC005572]|uniref:hypothetical protein n=1 Tax=Dactylosporangium sp. NPDC005572 TaxID=3156889 RepID=UPI00339E4FF7
MTRYLGAYGHLVVVREGDLALVHAHADDQLDGAIRFWLSTPAPGRYRMFLQFQHGQTAAAVNTAAFTVAVP